MAPPTPGISPAQVIGLGLLTLISSVMLFLYAESRAKDPIIPMSSVSQCDLSTLATLLGLLVGIGMFASIAFMPTYFPDGLRLLRYRLWLLDDSDDAWHRIFTINLNRAIGRQKWLLQKIPSHWFSLCAHLPYFLFSTLEVGQPVALVCLYIFMMGAGVGCIFQILILAVQNSVPFDEVGTAIPLPMLSSAKSAPLWVLLSSAHSFQPG